MAVRIPDVATETVLCAKKGCAFVATGAAADHDESDDGNEEDHACGRRDRKAPSGVSAGSLRASISLQAPSWKDRQSSYLPMALATSSRRMVEGH